MNENEIDAELKELADALGGWQELKKKIEQLEDRDNEAAFDRWSESKLANGEIV